MRPIQNLQLGGRQSKARYQYILQSVRADELYDWAVRLQDRLRLAAHRDVDVLVDRRGDEEAAMFPVIRWQVGATAAEGDAKGGTGDEHREKS